MGTWCRWLIRASQQLFSFFLNDPPVWEESGRVRVFHGRVISSESESDKCLVSQTNLSLSTAETESQQNSGESRRGWRPGRLQKGGFQAAEEAEELGLTAGTKTSFICSIICTGLESGTSQTGTGLWHRRQIPWEEQQKIFHRVLSGPSLEWTEWRVTADDLTLILFLRHQKYSQVTDAASY